MVIKSKLDEFFFKNIFENQGILEYKLEKDLSAEKLIKEMKTILNAGMHPLHLEDEKNNKPILIKDVNKTLYIKSGYYEINSSRNITEDMSFEQVSLEPTEKGYQFLKEYQKLLS